MKLPKLRAAPLLVLMVISAAAFGQQVGPISITSTQCAQMSVGSQTATIGIQVTGTWTGTLQPQVALPGQAAANTQVTPSTSSTAQSTITANGVYTVSVAGSATFLLCGNTVSSGTAVVFLNGSNAPRGSGGGGSGGTIAPGVANQLAIYTGASAIGGDSALTDDGTTLTYTGTGGVTTSGNGNQHTITQGTITTSKPAITQTATWNAGAVAFTNWLSNITCTAAATASIAEGLGVGGTTWQYKFNGANCTNPQLLVPDGTSANPSIAASTGVGNGILFQGASNNTILNAGNAVGVQIGGTSKFSFVTNSLLNGSGIGFCWSSNTNPFVAGADTCISRTAAGVAAIGVAAGGKTGLLQSGNTVFVTSNFTTSGVGTALENITGLTWTFPATALNFSFHCHLNYHQNVATAAVAFGLQDTTNAPANITAHGLQQTAATTMNGGVLSSLSTTTATNVVSATPSVITTDWLVDLSGTVEHAASAHTLNVMVSTATAADTVTVLRGSYCALTP